MVLRPSLKLTYLLSGVSFAACLTLLFLTLVTLLKVALVLLVLLLSIYRLLRDALLVLPHSCQCLVLNSKDEIILVQKNGKEFLCRVLPDSLVFSNLTVLQLKLNDCFWPRSLILLADSADADEFRRWRVWLQWGITWESRSRRH